MESRELLFSVTKKDCDWKPVKGSGAGGQHRNKVATGMRCTHRASGAVGVATDSKSQKHNKRNAFVRMSGTKEFKAWHKMQCSLALGIASEFDGWFDEENFKIEVGVG